MHEALINCALPLCTPRQRRRLSPHETLNDAIMTMQIKCQKVGRTERPFPATGNQGRLCKDGAGVRIGQPLLGAPPHSLCFGWLCNQLGRFHSKCSPCSPAVDAQLALGTGWLTSELVPCWLSKLGYMPQGAVWETGVLLLTAGSVGEGGQDKSCS